MIKFIKLCFITIIVVSCNKQVSRDELNGIYIANHKYGKDTLIIYSNNRYYRHLHTSNNKDYIQQDTITTTGEFIELNRFSFKILGSSDSGSNGIWPFIPEKSMGKIMINIDEDLGYHYLKIK